MNFIVLPYGVKSPLFNEYNTTFVSKISNITAKLLNKLNKLNYHIISP